MKKFVTGAALLLSVAAVAAQPKYPFGTAILNGGRVEPVRMTMVENSNEHTNFCFAARFPDNTIYLAHSKGIHTVTEYGCQDFSPDNGRTWTKSPTRFTGFNAYLDKQNRKIAVGCWSDAMKEVHTVTRRILSADGRSETKEQSRLTMPCKSSCRLHRDVVRLKNGRLLLTGYGRKEGASKLYSFVIASDDDGKTWKYLSTIMEDTKKEFPEGPNECAVIELANGDVLAYVRVGGTNPLYQLRSKDGGKTWGVPKTIAPFSVAPSVKLLSNGTLVVITGRPKLYLLLDFTGTGEHYQRYTVYHGAGSSYASVLETAPGEVMVIYDESDFGPWRNDNLFSRITALTLRIVRDDSAKSAAAAHPEAEKYEQFYSAFNGATPEFGRCFVPGNYNSKRRETGAWYEVRKIAERPHPVLHLENKGVQAPYKFATWTGHFNNGATECDLGFEFRLTEAGEKLPQFMVRVCFDAPQEKTRRYGFIGFGMKHIEYQDGNKRIRLPFDAGTSFHAYTVKASLKTGAYQLFKKGETKPLFTAKLDRHRDIYPGIAFGDGSSGVFGGVDLSYIGVNSK